MAITTSPASVATTPITSANTTANPLTPTLLVQGDTGGQTATMAEQPAAPETQTAFNDALLSIINNLLLGQGKDSKPQIVAELALKDSEDKNDDKSQPTPDFLTMNPQQMLDSLLQASQQPLKPVTLNGMPPQSGDALLMNHRSIGATVSVESPAPLTFPGGDGNAPLITKGMQSIAPQLLMTSLHESVPAAFSPAPGQNTTFIGNDKNVALPTTVRLEGGEDRWAQQLQSALGERLQVQVKNQIQHATIRLDPPDMGKIDISMQIENGRVQVHINASQGEVYRALQQVSNDLRQSLVEQNFLQVNVQISSQSGGQQQGGKAPSFPDAQAAILAAEAGDDSPQTDHLKDDSVLLTV